MQSIHRLIHRGLVLSTVSRMQSVHRKTSNLLILKENSDWEVLECLLEYKEQHGSGRGWKPTSCEGACCFFFSKYQNTKQPRSYPYVHRLCRTNLRNSMDRLHTFSGLRRMQKAEYASMPVNT